MIATTRGALIRGVTVDDLGDEVDATTAVSGYGDFPLSLIEDDATEFDQSSGAWRTVRQLRGRIPASVPIDDGDRIYDHRDGATYAVDSFTRTPRGLSGRSSVTMMLRRVSP